MGTPTIFLLSPANSGGRRAAMLARPEASFELAVRFRSGEASLGEVFAFLSGLYFRGKMAYSARFASPPAHLPGALVITPCSGLMDPATRVGPAELERFASVRVDPGEAGFAEPLRAAAGELAAALPPGARVVLLGSVATRRYLDPLLPALGDTLHFPAPFRGMGDMQRGALMLRAAASGEELPYARPDLPAPSRSSRRSPVPTRGTLAGDERS